MGGSGRRILERYDSPGKYISFSLWGCFSRWADVCDQDVCDPDVCDPDVCDLDVCDHLFVTKTFVTRTFVTILKTDVCDQELKF